MQRLGISGGLFALLLAIMPSGSAMAVDILSFNFGNLDGSFDSTSLLFTATNDATSNGTVSRLVAPTGDAIFDGATASSSFFDLSMTLSSLMTSSANGSGMLTLTDADGDKLIGTLNGTWTNNTGPVPSATFSGSMVLSVDSSMGNGTFDGQSGPGFSLNFNPAMPPFDGTAVTLQFGNWFTNSGGMAQSFSGANTSALGVVVPEPATLALLGLGVLGLAVPARRRRQS